jgi:hypothetical protein
MARIVKPVSQAKQVGIAGVEATGARPENGKNRKY